MNNISSLQHVCGLIDKGAVYWEIFDQGGKNLLGYNEDTSDKDGSKTALTDTLKELQGIVQIKLNSKTKEQKGAGGSIARNFVVYYRASNTTVATTTGGGGSSSYNTDRLLDMLLMREKEIGELKTQQVINGFQAQIDALKNQLNGGGETTADSMFLDLYQDVKAIVYAKQGLSPAAPIQGTNERVTKLEIVKEAKDGKEATAIINEALQDLAGVDGDLITHLQQLANLAKTNPGLYKTMVARLGNFRKTA